MPLLLGIRYITIPAGLNFTKDSDYVSLFLDTDNYRRGNVYCFFTLFFIPIIPLFCKQSVWLDKNGDPIYKREVSIIGKIFNQLFGIIGIIILIVLIGGLADGFGGGRVRRVYF